jgi:hypothetical protein
MAANHPTLERQRMSEATHQPEPPSVDPAALLDAKGKYLLGDYRDFILQTVKQHAPWKALSEGQQRDIINGATAQAREFVSRVIEIVAENGRPVVAATLESVAVISPRLPSI